MFASELIGFVFGKRRRWRVSGTSMEPDFVDGDLVLIEPSPTKVGFVPGDVVVARHPYKNLDVIKYVDAIDDGALRLRSPSGDDSSRFGPVLVSSVLGRVTVNLTALRR